MQYHHACLYYLLMMYAVQAVERYQYELRLSAPYAVLNKNLTYIRGVNYVPAPVGYAPQDGQAVDLYGVQYRALHHRDLRLIEQLGANSIRIYQWHEEVDHTPFLDLCLQYNLYVIMPFDPSYGLAPRQFDITDQRAVQLESVVTRWRSEVERYQNHSALLAYAVSNAPNQHSTTIPAAWYALTARLAQARNQLCLPAHMVNSVRIDIGTVPACWHPITLPLADTVTETADSILSLILQLELTYPNALDFYSFNLYRGHTFTTFFADYRRLQAVAGMQKAALITEFGMDAMDFRIGRGEVNGTIQSAALIDQWQHINRTLTTHHSFIGGLIFEYVDNWYRASAYNQPRTVSCPITDSTVHAICGLPSIHNDDQFYSVGYMGLTAHHTQQQEQQRGCLYMRAAYFDIAELWSGHTYSDTLRAHFCDLQRCCAYTDRTNWSVMLPLLALPIICIILYQCKQRQWLPAEQDSSSRASTPTYTLTPGRSIPYNRCYDLCYQTLVPAFARYLEAQHHVNPSSLVSVQRVQLHNLCAMLAQHMMQCSGSMPQAISIMHNRTLATYRGWCAVTGNTPNLQNQLDDIVAYIMVWAVAEQLRRVPSLICTLYHHRHNPQYNVQQIIQDNLVRIHQYNADYDTLDDQYRIIPTWKQRTLAWYDALYSVNGHVHSIGYIALLRIVYSIVQLHVILAICTVDVVRVLHQSDEQGGLIDMYAYLVSPAALSTWQRAAQADSILVLIGQLIDMFALVTIRIRHILIIVLACLCMSASMLPNTIPLFGIVSHTLQPFTQYIHMPHITGLYFGHTYCMVRLAIAGAVYLYAQFAPHRSYLPAPLFTSTGILSTEQHDGSLPVPAETAGGAQTVPRRYRVCCCVSPRSCTTVWSSIHCMAFWLSVLMCKLMFDTYILFPSVAAISLRTLCYTSLTNLLFDSAIPLNLAQLRHVANAENVHVPSPLDTPYTRSIACPAFEILLWCMTGLISLATTYVIYICMVAIVGSIVPTVYTRSTTVQRGVAGVVLFMWWLAVIGTLVAGHLLTAGSLLLPVALLCKLMEITRCNTQKLASSHEQRQPQQVRMVSEPSPLSSVALSMQPVLQPNSAPQSTVEWCSNDAHTVWLQMHRHILQLTRHCGSTPLNVVTSGVDSGAQPILSPLQLLHRVAELTAVHMQYIGVSSGEGCATGVELRRRAGEVVPHTLDVLQDQLHIPPLSTAQIDAVVSVLTGQPARATCDQIGTAVCLFLIAVAYVYGIDVCVLTPSISQHESTPPLQFTCRSVPLVTSRPLPLHVQIQLNSTAAEPGDTVVCYLQPVPYHELPSMVQLRTLLQPMFSRPLLCADVMQCWNMLVQHWRAGNLCSHVESVNLLSCAVFQYDNVDRLACSELQRRIRALIHTNQLLFTQHISEPMLLDTIKSLTVLIPIYSETVQYSYTDLLRPLSVSDGTSTVPSSAATLIDYIVAKHTTEFNNLAESLPRTPCNATTAHCTAVRVNGLTDAAQHLLRAFKHREYGGICRGEPTYIAAVIQFASLRGQTLLRTVAGLYTMYSALELHCRIQHSYVQSQQLESIIQSKIQILIGAQRYGCRTNVQQRAAVDALMKQYPNIEMVYDYNLIEDMESMYCMSTQCWNACIAHTSQRQGRCDILHLLDNQVFRQLPFHVPMQAVQSCINSASQHVAAGLVSDIPRQLHHILDAVTQVVSCLAVTDGSVSTLMYSLIGWQYTMRILQYRLTVLVESVQQYRACTHTAMLNSQTPVSARDAEMLYAVYKYTARVLKAPIQHLTQYTQMVLFARLCLSHNHTLHAQHTTATRGMTTIHHQLYHLHRSLMRHELTPALLTIHQLHQMVQQHSHTVQRCVRQQCQLLADACNVLWLPYTQQSSNGAVSHCAGAEDQIKHTQAVRRYVMAISRLALRWACCVVQVQEVRAIYITCRMLAYAPSHTAAYAVDRSSACTARLIQLHRQLHMHQYHTTYCLTHYINACVRLLQHANLSGLASGALSALTVHHLIQQLVSTSMRNVQQRHLHAVQRMTAAPTHSVDSPRQSAIELLCSKLQQTTQAALRQSVAALLTYPLPADVQCTAISPHIPPTYAQLASHTATLAYCTHYSVHAKYSVCHHRVETLHLVGRTMPLLLGDLPGHYRDMWCGGLISAPTTNPKSENQLHTLPFARGQVIQAIDMNGDFYLEQALKYVYMMRAMQYDAVYDVPQYVLVGAAEHIYSMHTSAIGTFMALQDWSFVTIVQRTLAYTGCRLHYGHPDMVDAYYCKYSIGLSKASAACNLSEDLFLATDMILRGQNSTYCEFIYYGKGRETHLLGTSIFENKLSRGAAQTLISSDMYRLTRWCDAVTAWSILYGSIGHFLYTLLFDYTIISFVWLLILMNLAHVDSERVGLLGSVYAIPWVLHLGYAFSLPLAAECIRTAGWLRGVYTFVCNFVTGMLYYLFQLRTKAYAINQALHGQTGGYAGMEDILLVTLETLLTHICTILLTATGRGVGMQSESMISIYVTYAGSHYNHALQMCLLMLLYTVYFSDQPLSTLCLQLYAVVIATTSWLLTPSLFNSSIQYANNRFDVIRSKKQELLAFYGWLRAPLVDMSTDTAVSWRNRWLSVRLQRVNAIAMQYMATSINKQHWLSHPVWFGTAEFVATLISWVPFLYLALTIVLTYQSHLLVMLSYTVAIAVMYQLLPVQLPMTICTAIVLLYVTIVNMLAVAVRNSMPYALSGRDLVSTDSIGTFVLLLVAVTILTTSMNDLMLCLTDISAAYKLYNANTIKTSLSTPSSLNVGQTAKVLPEQHSSTCTSLPRMYHAALTHATFFAYRTVYMQICPGCFAILHVLVSGTAAYLARAHTYMVAGVTFGS